MEPIYLTTWLCLIALGVSLMPFKNAEAIVIRHDRDDQKYLDLGDQYSDSVAYLGGNRCASTLIDDYWVLTAAHCVKNAELAILTVLHKDNVYRVGKVLIHPEYKNGKHDIALIQLTEPVANGKPVKLYMQENETGKSVVFVGRGEFGDGQLGVTGSDGKQRGATNTIIGTSEHWIEFKFNQAEEATEIEGISGGGDSGGPAFITVDSQLYVAGVSSHQDHGEHKVGSYGVTEYYTRVSRYSDWVNEVIANTEPGSSIVPDHPLIDAIKNDDESELKKAIDTEVFENEAVINEAFYQTLVLGRVSMAKELINQGADLRSVVINQLSLPELAILTEREDYAKMLVLDCRHLRNIHKPQSKVLPLLVALFDDDSKALEPVGILLDQGANINARNDRGDTALILAGWQTSNLELVRYLVENGADLNISNNNGDTPLMDAAYLGKNEILRFLLNSGADTSLRNGAGYSAQGLAWKRKNLKAFASILLHKTRMKLGAMTR